MTPSARGRDEGVVTEFFTLVNVRNVHFDDGTVESIERVKHGHGCMRIGGWD